MSDTDKKSYVYSNIYITVPLLFPWLILSGIKDIIFAAPFEAPKLFLSTTEGLVAYFLVFLFLAALFVPVIIKKF